MGTQSTQSFYIHLDSIIAKLGLEQDGAELSGAAKTNFQFRVTPPLEGTHERRRQQAIELFAPKCNCCRDSAYCAL